jgi:hypothetical protein
MQQLFIQFINYIWFLLHVSALHCHPQGAFLVPSERCSIEEQSIEYCGWVCCVTWCVFGVFVGFHVYFYVFISLSVLRVKVLCFVTITGRTCVSQSFIFSV